MFAKTSCCRLNLSCNYKMSLCEYFAWRLQGPAAPFNHSPEFKKGGAVSRLAVKIVTQVLKRNASNFTLPPRLCFLLFVFYSSIFSRYYYTCSNTHEWHHLAWVPHTNCSQEKWEKSFSPGEKLFFFQFQLICLSG